MDNSAKLDKWNAVKKHIDSNQTKQGVEIQRIYWTKIGQNVGSEVFGKGENFARPVLVISAFYNGTFLGVPLTSKIQNKRGRLYYKFMDNKGKMQTALLGQMKIFDIKRIGAYLSRIDDENFVKLKEKIKSEIIK